MRRLLLAVAASLVAAACGGAVAPHGSPESHDGGDDSTSASDSGKADGSVAEGGREAGSGTDGSVVDGSVVDGGGGDAVGTVDGGNDSTAAGESGCGFDGGGLDGGSMSAYCTAYADAICEAAVTCQRDVAACQAHQVSVCLSAAAQAVASGARQFQPGNVLLCVDAVAQAYGNGVTSVTTATIANYTAICDQVFVGTRASGSACAGDLDCACGNICWSPPGGGNSTCAPSTYRQLNDACSDPGDVCPPYAYCAPQSPPTCVAAQTVGQACGASAPCGGICRCVDGTCVEPASLGQSCTRDADCAPGLFCDTYGPPPACVSQLTLARASTDCIGIEGGDGG